MKKLIVSSVLSALAAASVLATPASAQAINFSGTTDGCFGAACVAGNTATSGGLTYNDSTFSGTTSDGFLAIGAGVASPNVDNLGSFTLTGAPGSYNGTVFSLLVNWLLPTSTPGSSTYSSTISGNVTSNSVGGVFIDFDNTPKNFTFNGGSFTFSVNDLSVIAGNAAPVTGTILATAPEPGTWAMLLLGFGMIGYSMRRRRSAQPAFYQAA